MTTTDANRVLRILGDLDRFLVEVLDPILKDLGMGREHWQVLRLLEDGEGHAMGELSQALGLPAATATRVADTLAANMLVYRRSDSLDRRRVLVYLAGPGREALSRIQRALTDYTSPRLARFDADERHDLLHLLERLLEARTD